MPTDLALTKISVRIKNAGVDSVYIAGDKMPFQIKDAQGKVWSSSIPPCGLACGKCSSYCANPYSCDPVPCYIEFPPGESLTLTWNGLIYDQSQNCSCSNSNRSCYTPKALASGVHTFLIPFTRKLDTKSPGSPFTKTKCELPVGNWDLVGWMKSGFGSSSFSQSRAVSVQYPEIGPIDLSL